MMDHRHFRHLTENDRRLTERRSDPNPVGEVSVDGRGLERYGACLYYRKSAYVSFVLLDQSTGPCPCRPAELSRSPYINQIESIYRHRACPQEGGDPDVVSIEVIPINRPIDQSNPSSNRAGGGGEEEKSGKEKREEAAGS
jgi:hypothetical protein